MGLKKEILNQSTEFMDGFSYIRIDKLLNILDRHESQVNEVNGILQLCPKCNGQGIMNKPPWVAGDQHEWSSTSTTFTCDVCNGAKVLDPSCIVTPTKEV